MKTKSWEILFFCSPFLLQTLAIMWIVSLPVPSFGQEKADYFPLQVGNRWIYGREGRAGPTLSVEDTIRLDVAQIQADTTFQQGFEFLPRAATGISYFLLSGSMVSHMLLRDSNPIEQILVRKAAKDAFTFVEGIPEEIQEQGLAEVVWLRGIFRNDRWLVYSLDRPFLNTDPDRFTLHLFNLKKGSPASTEYIVDTASPFNWGNDRSINVPAGLFLNALTIVIQHELFRLDSPQIYLAPNIGVIKLTLGNFTYEFLEGFVNNRPIPDTNSTAVEDYSWGKLKRVQYKGGSKK